MTQEELKNLLFYDCSTGVFIWKVQRGPVKPGMVAGSDDKLGYRIIRIKRKAYKAHRLAWLYVYGSFPTKGLDHINRNPSDNRINNLREATIQENSLNISLPRHNKSGYFGVSWHKTRKKWHASVCVHAKNKTIGYYPTALEAAKAREAYISSVEGAYGNLNFNM